MQPNHGAINLGSSACCLALYIWWLPHVLPHVWEQEETVRMSKVFASEVAYTYVGVAVMAISLYLVNMNSSLHHHNLFSPATTTCDILIPQTFKAARYSSPTSQIH